MTPVAVDHSGPLVHYEAMETMVKVGSKGRMTLAGHEDELFVRRDNEDGSILLQPAVVKTRAQEEYDTNPELQKLLREAMASPSVEWDYKRA